jgi:phosphatidylglycerophosphate synthase
MDTFSQRAVKKSRINRSKKWTKFADFLLKRGITANHMTFVSLICGLLAVFFLFENYFLFLLFGILHLFFDAYDGVLARLSKATKTGKYFDFISDQTISLLAIIKLGWFIQDYYVFIIAGLYLFTNMIHLFYNFEAPVIFMRSAVLIVLAFVSFPSFPFANYILTIGYLLVGATVLFSLGKQLQWFVMKIKSN